MKKLLKYALYTLYMARTRVRGLWWKSLLASFGPGSKVFGRVVVYYPENVRIGAHSSLNEGVILNARAPITIGEHVHISPRVIVNAGALVYEKTMAERVHTAAPVIIESGAWLGSGAIVNPGVTIGRNAVVGAGAVVTKNVPANTVVAGVPARSIRTIEDVSGSETAKDRD